MKCLVLLSISLAVASANFPTKPTNLRTTFGLNPLGNIFEPQPRTEQDAINYGYSRINTDGCSGTFLGFGYGDPAEPSFVALYDEAGYIAGVQNVVLKSVKPTVTDSQTVYQSGMFFDQEAWFNTLYFVDPEVICAGGRTEAQWEEQGTADRLWLQDGPVADKNYIDCPLTQADADSQARWYKHFCFPGMGTHYMEFDYTPDQGCDAVLPIQLMYDDGEITGFVWQQNVKLPGERWEHPDRKGVNLIVSDAPTCVNELADAGELSTLHHFFFEYPWLETCIF